MTWLYVAAGIVWVVSPWVWLARTPRPPQTLHEWEQQHP